MTFADEPQILPVNDELDTALEDVPSSAAVFVVSPREAAPYIAWTGALRRRLKRLLRPATQPSRLLNLRAIADRVEYWPVASRLQTALVLWDVARQNAPENYLEILKLRFPAYLKLILGNEFPRTQVTSRIAGTTGQFYGPFRSRGTAEEFEHQFLDLFQIRRCQEDLTPSPEHPGCIYGEMSMCLRPCQQVVGREEYAAETKRVSEFLLTGGQQMIRTAEAARDRLSAELDFEAAAREHKRIERIQHILKLRDELVADIDHLHGIAVTPLVERNSVQLFFMIGGVWQRQVPFSVALSEQSVSMDRRMKDIVSSLVPRKVSLRERQEHLAILARWFYSSWRDGEWISIPNLAAAPYRRIISAISRTAQ